MKYALTILITIVIAKSGFCQITDLKQKSVIENTSSINVYKINRKLPDCAPYKTAVFLEDNKIPPCFQLDKKLSSMIINRVKTLLTKDNSFQKPYTQCFSTDFGLILFDKKKKIIGNIAISSGCNNISLNGAIPMRLTNKAQIELLKYFQ